MKVDNPKPKDIFNQAVQIFFERLEPLGWRLLKNGDIKKKNGKLTYRIFFFRSYKNYIDYNEMKGSVTTEIYCNIDIPEREAVYQIRFEAPKPFNLLSKDCKLDIVLVHKIWKIIENEYINVISGLEENPRQQILKMGVMPSRLSPDYSYEIILRKQLLETLEITDLLKLYEINSKFYNSPENRAVIGQERYFYTIRKGIDQEKCQKLNTKELLCLVDEVYNFLKKTERFDEYMEAKYHHVKNLPQSNKYKWVIAVFWFVYPNIAPWFENEPSAQNILNKILDFHKKIKIPTANNV